ncbi:MAG TPA: HlyD family efflux transporter periplasmic adaptor subunit [Gemmatimonadaceae bacterium]|nr:HlyD family efflux transporter periplasmic adaptor subunit [Gemmatimonadaceae bacterium]
MTSRRVFPWSVGLLAAVGCSGGSTPDAYGNIEATEIVVSAQTSGQLLSFTPTDGATLAGNTIVAVVDTTQIMLQRRQAAEQRAGNTAHIEEVAQQIKALEAQRAALQSGRDGLVTQQEIAQRNADRMQRLLSQKAATAQQFDQADQTNRVLADQIKAQDQQIDAENRQIDALRAQQQSAGADAASTEAHVAQFADQLRKSEVRNPISGTVLTTYVKPGEFVQPGTPLYAIANLDTLELRAYLTEPQLGQIRLGGPAQLSVDVGANGKQTLTGTVDWISSQAEFTPTPIETEDERTNLVYAIKIRVANPNGTLKIGMPAGVHFVHTTAAR